MTREDCFHLGAITRLHGVRGQVRVYLDVDNPSAYKKLESVYVDINNKLVPFSISQVQIIKNSQAIFTFSKVNTYDDAAALVGKALYLPDELLPDLSADQFYLHEIIGYMLIDENRGELGEIKDIFDYGVNRVVQVFYQSKELLLPLHQDMIVKLDKEKQQVVINTAEGLIDLYLSDGHAPED